MFNEAVITTAGLALDAKIRAGEAVAKFTNIKLGDGQYSGTEDLNEATALKSVRQTFGVSSIKRTNETTVRLRIIADNGGMADGYYISELGVYAEDPDDGEILYSIATGMTGKMDYQPSEEELEGATSTIDIFTSVSNAESAIISTGTGAAASAEELADLEIRTSNLETPEFDDSGEVEGIGSFPDFLERVKSKMDFFRFFRDFKAGMKFVLHAGQIVNNCMSDSTELPLGASQGKVLMDLITQLNSNLRLSGDANNFHVSSSDEHPFILKINRKGYSSFYQMVSTEKETYFGKSADDGGWKHLYKLVRDVDYPLVYKGVFSGDLNRNPIEPGYYTIGSPETITNGPSSRDLGYCILIQFHGYRQQMIIDNANIYGRKYAGAPEHWFDWAKVGG